MSERRIGRREVVVTGLGIVSPIGIGRAPFWESLQAGKSGIVTLTLFDTSGLPIHFGGQISDFDPVKYVKPRKSLKVMSREIQLAVTAAELAMRDAGIAPDTLEPERKGVVLGCDWIQPEPENTVDGCRAVMAEGPLDVSNWGRKALGEIYPLWMLKYLPNMPACHVAIAHDARGPCNSIVLGEVSSLLAIREAARVIERGAADLIITGGTGNRLHPTTYLRTTVEEISRRNDDPSAACRPFDAGRDGLVNGEGSAMLVLESREHAEARGAKILARVLGTSSTCEARRPGGPKSSAAIERALSLALADAGVSPSDLGHVSAHGIATRDSDRLEAQAIRKVLGDVPVTAYKSYFGHLGAGSGAMEMAASVLALGENEVPRTLNHDTPDPECPITVIDREPLSGAKPLALVASQAITGQAAALVLGGPLTS